METIVVVSSLQLSAAGEERHPVIARPSTPPAEADSDDDDDFLNFNPFSKSKVVTLQKPGDKRPLDTELSSQIAKKAALLQPNLKPPESTSLDSSNVDDSEYDMVQAPAHSGSEIDIVLDSDEESESIQGEGVIDLT